MGGGHLVRRHRHRPPAVATTGPGMRPARPACADQLPLELGEGEMWNTSLPPEVVSMSSPSASDSRWVEISIAAAWRASVWRRVFRSTGEVR